ncbi:MAG: PAC2 family protein [Pirellulaceae bacterium]|jgi:proteasome assembly chaperone (PAC2) family protein|nr:PAC2 family protein [Pirellulaceae bacterium]
MSRRTGETDALHISYRPTLQDATLVLAFSGWMDGGDVSTGTVSRLVQLTGAQPFADIDPDPFYIYNFPGSMEIAALFRPHVQIENGLVRMLALPTNIFYYDESANVVLFIGKEPNLRWRQFGICLLRLAAEVNVRRILFVGSYGGAVPHTRQPHLYVTCSDENLLPEMSQYGTARTGYEGPGSFITYLMTQAPQVNIDMISLVAEIPSYLQGPNVSCIEAVTRRLAKILRLPLDLDSLRAASTRWELEVSKQIEQDDSLAHQIRKLEEAYDDQLLEEGMDEQ